MFALSCLQAWLEGGHFRPTAYDPTRARQDLIRLIETHLICSKDPSLSPSPSPSAGTNFSASRSESGFSDLKSKRKASEDDDDDLLAKRQKVFRRLPSTPLPSDSGLFGTSSAAANKPQRRQSGFPTPAWKPIFEIKPAADPATPITSNTMASPANNTHNATRSIPQALAELEKLVPALESIASRKSQDFPDTASCQQQAKILTAKLHLEKAEEARLTDALAETNKALDQSQALLKKRRRASGILQRQWPTDSDGQLHDNDKSVEVDEGSLDESSQVLLDNMKIMRDQIAQFNAQILELEGQEATGRERAKQLAEQIEDKQAQVGKLDRDLAIVEEELTFLTEKQGLRDMLERCHQLLS